MRRGADGPGRISVDYSIEPDDASPGLDFISANGTLFFEANDLVQTIRVPILPDTLNEPNETFRVVLSNPGNGASLGAPSTATVRILDNDQGFGFGASTYTVGEGDGGVILNVIRATDASGVMSVDYAVEPVTAAADADYTPVNGTLIFAAGESSRMIRVPILQVQDLSKSYRQAGGETTVAIGNITCAVEAGEFVSFVGPSGCGKTTLLMSIAGLLAPSAGKIVVNGKEVCGPPRDLVR